jgi:CheY-like chemotaxis protein
MKHKFIVIDDNPVDLLVASRMVEYAFETSVISLKGSTDALDYFKHNSIEENTIILLDIKMPEFDGFQFLDHFEFFKESFRHRSRIFLLTSSLDKHDLERAASHNLVVKLLNKPLNVDELKQLLLHSEKV